MTDTEIQKKINELFEKLDRRGTHPDSRIVWTDDGWRLEWDD